MSAKASSSKRSSNDVAAIPRDELARILVVSPHLDDAAFACGRLLATYRPGIVVTVFGGAPLGYPELTEWDRACGFSPGEDVVAARRAEDRAALALLGATPVWLCFLDAQYAPPPELNEIAAALDKTLRDHRPSAVFFPLGIFHSDHKLVHEACRSVALRWSALSWFIYEDALYRASAGLSEHRLAEVRAAGFDLADAHITLDPSPEPKQRAVACYVSQLRGLVTPGRPGLTDLAAPEHYWRLRVPAAE